MNTIDLQSDLKAAKLSFAEKVKRMLDGFAENALCTCDSKDDQHHSFCPKEVYRESGRTAVMMAKDGF